MHWAQTANHGVIPNRHLPNTFGTTAHDLADPWADGCWQGPMCCLSTGKPVDARCNLAHRGWLLPHGAYTGAGEPVTPSMGVTIHPRVKRPIGERLATAAWSLVYGHQDVPFVGPVISGCKVTGSTVLLSFNTSLLKGGHVVVSAYNESEQASVTWVRTKALPGDADKNWLYQNRQGRCAGGWCTWFLLHAVGGASADAVVAVGSMVGRRFGVEECEHRGRP
jgi:hypothetical protein